ncbi:hypothetical protein M9H77_03367 [Catharanthus roseus]|uniref:Uncharacterized protein n=1 Tax=Catharanthus roseus TaxID=4058 RepID=A0ACC0CBH2_CATRO|nr:hypothetical protein M9H77_03367 [Catharanthus roseus]
MDITPIGGKKPTRQPIIKEEKRAHCKKNKRKGNERPIRRGKSSFKRRARAGTERGAAAVWGAKEKKKVQPQQHKTAATAEITKGSESSTRKIKAASRLQQQKLQATEQVAEEEILEAVEIPTTAEKFQQQQKNSSNFEYGRYVILQKIKLFLLVFIEHGDHFTFINSLGTYLEKRYFIDFNSISCAITRVDDNDFNIANCVSCVLGVEDRRSMEKELGPILEDLSIRISLNTSSLCYEISSKELKSLLDSYIFQEFSATCLHHNINERKETYHGVRKLRQKLLRNVFKDEFFQKRGGWYDPGCQETVELLQGPVRRAMTRRMEEANQGMIAYL